MENECKKNTFAAPAFVDPYITFIHFLSLPPSFSFYCRLCKQQKSCKKAT